MKSIFKDVNIDSMNFINNKNDIKFEFLDSLANSGKHCGELTCINVLSLNMKIDEDDPYFAVFVCDIILKKVISTSTYHISFLGSAYEIEIICKDIDIKN